MVRRTAWIFSGVLLWVLTTAFTCALLLLILGFRNSAAQGVQPPVTMYQIYWEQSPGYYKNTFTIDWFEYGDVECYVTRESVYVGTHGTGIGGGISCLRK